jgi:RNA polymerase sigma-70 factor (ECF subfamily)
VSLSTNQVWVEFRESLRRFIVKRVQDEQDAEDILQNIFYKIHTNIDNLKDENKLQSWLYQITRNTIIDYYRSRKTAVQLPDIPQESVDKFPSDASPEIDSCVNTMIDGLPEKYREAIVLTDLKGLTRKEMAKNLGLSLSGAKSRVQRARGKLKEELLECCHFEFDRSGNLLDFEPKENGCNCFDKDLPKD